MSFGRECHHRSRSCIPMWGVRRLRQSGCCGRCCCGSSIRNVRARSVFRHFPITSCLVACKCRRSSELGFTRGSLGSSDSATELRPLVVSNSTQESIVGTAISILVISILDAPPFCHDNPRSRPTTRFLNNFGFAEYHQVGHIAEYISASGQQIRIRPTVYTGLSFGIDVAGRDFKGGDAAPCRRFRERGRMAEAWLSFPQALLRKFLTSLTSATKNPLHPFPSAGINMRCVE